jgi:hypothetical protein
MANPCGFVLVLALTSALEAWAEGGLVEPETVLVPSGELKLRALLWQPAGHPPFPAILFNHGTGRSTATEVGHRDEAAFAQQAAVLGPLFAKHGYAFLFLFRRAPDSPLARAPSPATFWTKSWPCMGTPDETGSTCASYRGTS